MAEGLGGLWAGGAEGAGGKLETEQFRNGALENWGAWWVTPCPRWCPGVPGRTGASPALLGLLPFQGAFQKNRAPRVRHGAARRASRPGSAVPCPGHGAVIVL